MGVLCMTVMVTVVTLLCIGTAIAALDMAESGDGDADWRDWPRKQ